MKKGIASIVALVFIITSSVVVTAHPEPIKEKTFDLKADTIFVWQQGKAASSSADKSVTSYTIEYIDSQAENADEIYKMYPTTHSKRLGGNAILKVDISSIKYASDFSLKFSFITGDNKYNCIRVYRASYKDGEKLISGLTAGNTKSVATSPNICSAPSSNIIYEFQKTTDAVERADVELSVKDSSSVNPLKYGDRLEEHINNAIKNGEDSVYFLVRGEILPSDSPRNQWTDDGSYCMLYNSTSPSKAPTLTVTGSAISSEIVKTETGYTYKVSGLKNYTDNAIVAVTAYDGNDTLIKIATSGEVTVTEGDTVSVDIACASPTNFKAYIWKAETLEPITYIETISLTETK